MGSLARIRGRLEQARGLTRRVEALPLRIEPELAVLREVPTVADLTAQTPPSPGVLFQLETAQHIPEEVMLTRLAGRTAGHDMPPWHAGHGGAPMAGVMVSRVAQALHLPEYGAVITQDGRVLRSSVAEALYLTPSLAALPGVAMVDGAPRLTVRRGMPVIDRGAVFMAWGGRFNYGHFLIDCMAALAALERCGLTERFTLITPALNDWQRETLRLFLGEPRAARVREITAPVIHIDDAVFASAMDHFLHAPNRPLDVVRARMLAAIDEPPTGVSRLYVNRLSDTKRPLVNELELEAALVARGFVSVAPETLSLSRQIALFRDADVIVGPTGAALANVLFCKPGAQVFELQPTNFIGIWARGLSHFVEASWHGFFAPSPLSEADIHIEGVPKPGVSFHWRIETPEVLAWIDRGLEHDKT